MGEQFAALIAGKHTDMDTINGMLLFAILIVAAFFFVILCIGEGKKEDGGKYFGKYRKAPPIYPCGDSSSLLCKHSFCRCQQWTSSRPCGSRCSSCSHWVTHHVLHGIQ